MDKTVWYQAYEKATNVSFQWTYWSDWATQLGVALAGDDMPDLIFDLYNEGLDKASVLKYGQQGMFVDYKKYIKYMPDLTTLMDANPESYACVENDDGSMYALPCFTETPTAFTGPLYYRTDMFKEAGVSVPKTTDELLQTVKTLQQYFGKDNNKFIAFQPYSSTHLTQNLLYYLFPSFGDDVDIEFGSKDGKTVTYNYISDQYRHMMEYVNQLYVSGGFDKNIFSEDGTNAKAVILGNNTAITTLGTIYTKDNFKSGNYDVSVFDPLTSQYTSKQKYAKGYASRMGMFEISSKCKDIDTMVKWVNALYADVDHPIAQGVSSISMWLGIKGTTWDFDDSSKQTYTIKVPSDYSGDALSYLTEYGLSNAANCVFMSMNSSSLGLLCKGNGTKDHLLPYAVQIFPKDFLSFTEDESSKLAEAYTDIQEYISKSLASFVTQGVNDSSWNAYVDTVKKMGIDDIVKIYQDAFDRYNSKVK